jgi:prepilin peptidase CpaA
MGLFLIRAALWVTATVLLAAAARTDFRARIIPNRVVAAIAANGLLLGLLSRPDRVWISLLVALVLLIGLGFIAHLDLIGGGDAKLISAVTLLVPPETIAPLLLAIALAGGIVSGAYLVVFYAFPRARNKKKTMATRWFGRLPQRFQRERMRVLKATSVPYSVAVLGGVSVVTVSEIIRCYSATSCSP